MQVARTPPLVDQSPVSVYASHAESAAFGGDTKLVRVALASLCFEDSKARLARSTSDRGIFTLRFALRCRSRRFLDIRSRT